MKTVIEKSTQLSAIVLVFGSFGLCRNNLNLIWHKFLYWGKYSSIFCNYDHDQSSKHVIISKMLAQYKNCFKRCLYNIKYYACNVQVKKSHLTCQSCNRTLMKIWPTWPFWDTCTLLLLLIYLLQTGVNLVYLIFNIWIIQRRCWKHLFL